MHFLIFGTPSASSAYAAKALKHTVQVMPYRADSLEDICFGQAFGFSDTASKVDILVTSAPTTKISDIKIAIATFSPKLIVWDLGPKAPTKETINRVIVPLQILGYKPTIIKGLSAHELGYNYVESRTVIVAKFEEEPIVLPSKLKIKKPYTPLSSIIKTDGDEEIIPFHNGNMLFHKEPRPWSFVSKPRGDSHLLAHPLSMKVGAVWYAIEGKLHRLTVPEAGAIVGYPLSAQKRLQELCQDTGLVIYTILRDLSYPVWLDLFERVS